MRISRSSDEWRALILQQQESGLSVAAFCREHELAPTSFYSSRARLLDKSVTSPSKFIRARLTQELEQSEAIASTQAFEIFLGKVKLSLPASSSPDFLAELMRGLSA